MRRIALAEAAAMRSGERPCTQYSDVENGLETMNAVIFETGRFLVESKNSTEARGRQWKGSLYSRDSFANILPKAVGESRLSF